MMKLTIDEQKVLIALSELEPASLDRLAGKTGIEVRRLKALLVTLARKGLLQEGEGGSPRHEKEQT